MVDLNLTTSVITLGVNDLNNEEENIVILDKKKTWNHILPERNML